MSERSLSPASVTTVDTVEVLAETVRVSKRVIETDRTLIHKTVSESDAVVDALLSRTDVDVKRISVNRIVSEVPPTRQDGDTWIFPIMVETVVVEKRFVLKEEVHVTLKASQEQFSETVRLREEHVTVSTEPAGEPSNS